MRAGHPDPQTDARLFLLALRQFLKAERLGFAQTRPGSQEAQRLDNARARLCRAVPGAKDAGDIIDHFADYAEGKGDLQPGGALRRGERPRDPAAAAADWPFGYDAATDRILLGRLAVTVPAVEQHVTEMHVAMWSALRHLQ